MNERDTLTKLINETEVGLTKQKLIEMNPEEVSIIAKHFETLEPVEFIFKYGVRAINFDGVEDFLKEWRKNNG